MANTIERSDTNGLKDKETIKVPITRKDRATCKYSVDRRTKVHARLI